MARLAGAQRHQVAQPHDHGHSGQIEHDLQLELEGLHLRLVDEEVNARAAGRDDPMGCQGHDFHAVRRGKLALR
ncbi:MAG TPA: hypothetical protein VFZ63_00295 [Jiangellaceae bacterium]